MFAFYHLFKYSFKIKIPKLYTNWLKESFSTFVSSIGLKKVGTSWILRKGGILEKGVGVDLEKGCVNPLTNYDYYELKQICTKICF